MRVNAIRQAVRRVRAIRIDRRAIAQRFPVGPRVLTLGLAFAASACSSPDSRDVTSADEGWKRPKYDASTPDSGTTDAAACSTSTTILGNALPSSPSQADANPVELGMKFQTTTTATITGVRFYKGSGNTGTHIGKLYSRDGTLLASTTFTNETASGWQTALFDQPVLVSANTTYVVSYYAPAGHYAGDSQGMAFQINDPTGTVHSMANGADGGNGVYFYGAGGGFPTSAYQATNYYVDVIAAVLAASVACTPDSGTTADAGTADSAMMDGGAPVYDASADGSPSDGGSAADSQPSSPPPDGGVAACDQTLSPGADVASAISNAPAGTTICLSSGSYGNVSLSNVTKSSDVTVQPVSGGTASLALHIDGSNHLKFQNLTVSGMGISGGTTKSITVHGCKFTGQAEIDTNGMASANILIDSSTFDGISVCSTCSEGRLQISQYPSDTQPVGVSVTNNHFGNGGESDGIQVGAYGVIIGPGNVFDGIVQGNYSRHVDSIQLYGQSHTTINGNYFTNSDTFIMAPDGGDTETVTNNTFAGVAGQSAIQFGSHVGDMILHNTVVGTSFNIDAKSGEPASASVTARDNLFMDAWYNLNCTGCTITHSLFNQSGNASGTDNIIGMPTFVGGSSPATWTGYALTSSSLGYRAGSDGKDMGATIFGPGQ